ncbi:LacI family DNA-binding transcriptional regulator [Limosilactobacillus sp. STM2_1]|uniref:LacI family DNA-binding transcriptional regulator n=1 Tax=Limosilactobacillus rudii TaxID=2759755 RepID=A0A7W3YMH7_9LACO|nr:LacI family DNA-binding transcriptional regulator [Limosilactobacillus rudii]MBB1078366.1 LacI family DNA-binding transcriptional regulator [Limosilactobacillus rudii]MBB1096496.1 LacI family DNA-binding transcriptional regulator [Limosilactobacillus rudii]MCD7134307.1 LacI family transcriptional regulator [Limosilactobacillus rudii]
MKPTIKDIAQRANVSTATVSRVLSKKEKSYRPETAAKIEAIAKELGYKKNLAAAELAANSSKLIAVILNNTQTNFSNDIIAAVQAETDKAGYQMFILYAGNHNARLLNQAISVALERHVAGILLVATSLDDQAATTLKETSTPCRLVSVYDQEDQRYRGLKFISSDNERIGYLATKYLLARGHQRIGLAGIDHSSTGEQRLHGYQRAMVEQGLVPQMDWVKYGDYSFGPQQNILKSLYNKNLDALITASDMVAVGVVKEARLLGIKIPDDLSLVSIDGTFLCDITIPTITSVTQNFYQMGTAAIKSLLNDRDSEFIPVRITSRDSVQQMTSKIY